MPDREPPAPRALEPARTAPFICIPGCPLTPRPGTCCICGMPCCMPLAPKRLPITIEGMAPAPEAEERGCSWL
eukprot:15341685-Ditylum_brightwellii.AAC.1